MKRFRLKRMLGPVVVLVAAVALAYAMAACGSSGPKPTPKPSGPQPPAWLSARAYWQAKIDHDPHPTSAVWVLTTVSVVQQVMHEGASAQKPQQVYLVVEYGHFLDTVSSRPPGAGDFHGTMIYFTADPKTHMVFEYSIGPTIPLSPIIAHKVRTFVPSPG
jgi:hypothetical protein